MRRRGRAVAVAAALLLSGCAAPVVVAAGPEAADPPFRPAPAPAAPTTTHRALPGVTSRAPAPPRAPVASLTPAPARSVPAPRGPGTPAPAPSGSASPGPTARANAPDDTPRPADQPRSAAAPAPDGETTPSLQAEPAPSPATAPAEPAATGPAADHAAWPRAVPGAAVSPTDGTQRLVVDAVGADGAVRPGYRVVDLPVAIPPIDCSADPGSTAAITGGLHGCAEPALATTACWAAKAEPRELLCLPDAWSATLLRLPARGVRPTPPAADPVPFGVQLADGSRWTLLRAVVLPGGRVSATPAYRCESGCTQGEVLVRVAGAPLFDIAEPLWTIQRAGALGLNGESARRAVVAAVYYLAAGS